MNHKTLLALLSAGLVLAPFALQADETKPPVPPKVNEGPKPAPGEGPKPGPGEGPNRGPRINPEERLKMMKEKLGLSDEQTGKIKEVLEKNRAEYGKLRDAQGTPEEKREKFMAVRKTEMEEIGAILTPEQKEKWQEEMKKRREEGGPRRNGDGPKREKKE